MHLRRRMPGSPHRADARTDGRLLFVRSALTDEADAERVAAAAETLLASVAIPLQGRRKAGVLKRDSKGSRHARREACIFLNRPVTPGCRLCLHRAAIDRASCTSAQA